MSAFGGKRHAGAEQVGGFYPEKTFDRAHDFKGQNFNLFELAFPSLDHRVTEARSRQEYSLSEGSGRGPNQDAGCLWSCHQL
jgi:hypothetical protein